MSNVTAGVNAFTFYVANITGAGVTGLTQSDFTTNGYVGNNSLTATIGESPDGGGYYFANFDIPAGEGYVQIEPVDVDNLFVYPTFYEIFADTYSTDDVYASIARQSLDSQQTFISDFEGLNIGPYKQGDDVLIEYVVPDAITVSISGWSDYKASLWDSTILTEISGNAGYQGEITILSVDTANKIVTLLIPHTITDYLVSEGNNEEYYYSDLQARDTSGYRRTLAEFSILFRRHYTRG